VKITSTSHSDPMELESDLCDAVHRARIAATLLERDLGNKAAHEEITGRSNTYYMSEQCVESVLFAVYETQRKITALRDRYLRAID
jgi:hypothetical protein